jgi:HPr kinase/phosphorylase
MTEAAQRVHATCVAIDGAGVLLRGPSGSGKSDLALRLIDAGALLVADDQTELRREGDEVVATAPATIAGQLEVRGLGIVETPTAARAPLRLVVDIVSPAEVERLPEEHTARYCGIEVSLLKLAPFESSAAAKLRAALRSLVRREGRE